MSSVTVKYKPSASNNGTLVYILDHDGESCDIDSGLKVKAGEWDSIISRVVIPDSNRDREQYLRNVGYKIETDLKTISGLMRYGQTMGRTYSLREIAHDFRVIPQEPTLRKALADYMDSMAGGDKQKERYITAVNAFLSTMGNADIALSHVTPEKVVGFKKKLAERKRSRFTIITYLTSLASIYNKAVERGMVIDRKPFGDDPGEIGDYGFVQKDVFPDFVDTLRGLDLPDDDMLAFTRDLLLMAHLSGLTLAQLATLTEVKGQPRRYRCIGPTIDDIRTIDASDELDMLITRHRSQSPSGYILPVFSKRKQKVTSPDNLSNRTSFARKRLRPYLETLSQMISYPGTLTLSAAVGSKSSCP